MIKFGIKFTKIRFEKFNQYRATVSLSHQDKKNLFLLKNRHLLKTKN